MLVFPTMTAPASRNFCVRVDSYGGTKLLSIFEPAVVFTPSMQKLSFTAIGMPSSGSSLPLDLLASDRRACSSAKAEVTVINAFISGCSSMFLRNISVTSLEETSLLLNALLVPPTELVRDNVSDLIGVCFMAVSSREQMGKGLSTYKSQA